MYVNRESVWQWLYTRSIQFLVIVFAAFMLLGIIGMFVEVFGDDEEPLPADANCFLDRAPTRDGEFWTRTKGRRAWVRRFSGLVDQALDGREFPTRPIVMGVSYHESRWKRYAIGPIGEHGLMQIHPSRVRAMLRRGEHPLDPVANLRMGVSTLATCRSECGDDLGRTLHCYAAGECASPGPAARDLMRHVEVMQACSDEGG